MFGPPKTETSYRKILIDESLTALLTRHVIKQKEIKLKLAERHHRETILVFERGNGLPIQNPPYRGLLFAYVEKQELQNI